MQASLFSLYVGGVTCFSLNLSFEWFVPNERVTLSFKSLPSISSIQTYFFYPLFLPFFSPLLLFSSSKKNQKIKYHIFSRSFKVTLLPFSLKFSKFDLGFAWEILSLMHARAYLEGREGVHLNLLGKKIMLYV